MIVRQIEEMKEKGIGGFFIHPRQGLEVPYLSSEWFEKVSIAIETAKRCGLEVWLYDEYPYPSGISAGEVVIGNPEYQAYILDYKIIDAEPDKEILLQLPMSDVILARAYRVKGEDIIWDEYIDLDDSIGISYTEDIYQESGLTVYNRKRFFAGNSVKIFRWRSPSSGQWKVFLFYQYPLKDFKYFGTFIDPLNRDAVRYFIQTTYERYKRYFSHEFGKTIKGIFTDETAPFGGRIPWSRRLPYLFKERYGYDLIEILPRIVDTNIYDDLSSRLRYQYWRLVVDTFIESYDKQISDWCCENNLLYVGEKPILRPYQLALMDIPGVDTGHIKAGDGLCIVSENYRANPKVTSSMSHFYGKDRTLCECFHSIGWSMSIQDMKYIFDQLILSGVNMFVPHAYFYTTDGLKKHDAPPSSFFQMPWWRHQGLLSKYVSEHAKLLSESRRKVDVLLLDPTPSMWTVSSNRELRERFSGDFCKVQNELLRCNIDYYIIDQTLLEELSPKDGRICRKDDEFEILIIPPIVNIEKDAWIKVKELILNGCKILFIGCLPYQRIEDIDIREEIESILGIDPLVFARRYLQEEAFDKIKVYNTTIIDSPSKLKEGLKDFYVPYLEIVSNPQDDLPILSAYFEKDEDRNLLFLINPSTTKKECLVKILKDGKDFLSACVFGEEDSIFQIEELLDGTRVITITFAPFQSYLVELRKNSIEKRTKQTDTTEWRIDLDSEWEISLDKMNPLRIDDWHLELLFPDNKKMVGQMSSTTGGKPIIDQIEELKIPVLIKTYGAFGTPKKITFQEFEAVYSHSFYSELEPQDLWLVIEDGSISGDFYIEINGNKILPNQFEIKEFYSPTNLAISIGNYIHKGDNNICICVKIQKPWNGLLTPVYLFGDIGVVKRENRWTIKELPKKGYFGKNIENRIPFYAGQIIYEKEIELNPNSNYKFYIDQRVDSSISLYINDVPVGTRCWSPYEWVIPKTLLSDKIKIKIEVSTALLALFEGETIDIETHKLSKI